MIKFEDSETYNEVFKIPFYILKFWLVDTSMNEKKYNLKEKIISIGRNIYFLICNISMITVVTISTVSLTRGAFDINKLTVAINVVISMITIVMKAFTLLIRKTKIMAIIQHLNRYYSKKNKEKYKIDKSLERFKSFQKVHIAFWTLPIFSMMVLPLVVLIFTGQKTLPMFVSVPEVPGILGIILYVIVYLWLLWSSIQSSSIMICHDLIYCGVLATTKMEFDVLRKDFEDLKTLKNPQYSKQLKVLIDRHKELYDVSNQINAVFSATLCVYYYIVSAILCLFAYQLSTATEVSNMIFGGTFVIPTLIQNYVVCYFGQILKDGSDGVFDGIINCGWENIDDIDVKKFIIMMIQRTQKPAKLTAWKFTDITLVECSQVSFKFVF
jgi:7tm Odorant receptor